MRVENYCIVSVYCVNGKSLLCVREIFSPVKLCVVIVCSVVCVDSVFSSVRETRWMSYATVCFVPLHPFCFSLKSQMRKSIRLRLAVSSDHFQLLVRYFVLCTKIRP